MKHLVRCVSEVNHHVSLLIQYALIVPSLSRPHTSNLPSLSPSPSFPPGSRSQD